jgi:eukaryotic-like serine/threonine-protein kinase
MTSVVEMPSLSLAADLDAGDAVTAPPIIARLGGKNVLIAASSAGRVTAWSLDDFGEIWRAETGDSFEAAPLVIGSRVFTASLEGNVSVLDLSTGKKVAHSNGIGQIKGGLSSDPSGKAFYAGSYDNHLYKISSVDLSVVWRFASGSFINGRPRVLKGGGIAFGSCDGSFYVVDDATGSQSSRVRGSSYIPATAALDGRGTAFFAGYDGDLTAWSVADGVRWVASPDDCSNVTSPAAYGEGRVFIADQRGSVFAFDSKDGKALWRFEAGADVEFDMLPVHGTLVLSTLGGTIFILDAITGEEFFSYPLGGTPSLGCAWADPWICVGNSTGRILVFKLVYSKGRK